MYGEITRSSHFKQHSYMHGIPEIFHSFFSPLSHFFQLRKHENLNFNICRYVIASILPTYEYPLQCYSSKVLFSRTLCIFSFLSEELCLYLFFILLFSSLFLSPFFLFLFSIHSMRARNEKERKKIQMIYRNKMVGGVNY